MDRAVYTFKGLLNIDGFLGTSLKVGNITLRLAEGGGSLTRNLPAVNSFLVSILYMETYSTLVLFEIDFVA